MDPRSIDRSIRELNRVCTSFRLTVRMGSGGILHCDAWQEQRGSRRPHVLWEKIDTWVADSPLTVVRSLDDVQELFAESTMARRLPGIG